MKILIDCRFWGVEHTGLGRYTQNLVENLLKIDNKNKYTFLFNQKAPKIKAKNVDFKVVDIPHYSLIEQIRLPKVLNELKPDLIHFPHFNLPAFCSFPYIVTIHDLIKHQFTGLKTTTRQPAIYFLKHLGYRFVFNRAVAQAKMIITPSKFVKKEISKFYPGVSKKVKVVYNGVSKVKKTSSGTKTTFGRYKIKPPFLLYVGSIYPHKNLRRLIWAVKSLNQKGNSLSLVIVSARNVFLNRLKAFILKAKAQKYILTPGFVSDQELGALYSQALAFVYPSLMEGFGLPGLEAMALSCPVICSNIPTFKEVYQNAALFFNPKDADDIENKILNLSQFSKAKRGSLIELGFKQAKQYSWKKCSQQTLKLYERCLSL